MSHECILLQRWEMSHLLENLSGMDASCSMLNGMDEYFPIAMAEAEDRGMTISGLYGVEFNRGSTQQAMEVILGDFKQVRLYGRYTNGPSVQAPLYILGFILTLYWRNSRSV